MSTAIRNEILEVAAELRAANLNLQAEALVEAARDAIRFPNLHASFEWNDAEAAAQYRLIQAHQLIIRCRITIEDGKTIGLSLTKPIRQFVSYTDERGYRNMVDVVGDTTMLARLYDQMEADLVRLQERLQTIETLRPRTTKPVEKTTSTLNRWLAEQRAQLDPKAAAVAG